MTYAKIGSQKIALTDEVGTDPEVVRAHLQPLYPEVKNATVRVKTEDENTVIEFLPVAGRKG